MLQSLIHAHKDNLDNYTSMETSGPSLLDALERYQKYERRLKDNVRPNEDTLRRFTQNYDIHQTLNQSISLKSNTFPHGDLPNKSSKPSKQQQTNQLTDSSSDEESLRNGENDDQVENAERSIKSSTTTRQLPNITSTGASIKQQASIRNHTERLLSSKKATQKPKVPSRVGKTRYDTDSKDDFSDDSLTDVENTGTEEIGDDKEKTEIKYDLETILKNLDEGYYVSRIQIRNAFALYLFKIHVRLVAESQFKDDSNLQQMVRMITYYSL